MNIYGGEGFKKKKKSGLKSGVVYGQGFVFTKIYDEEDFRKSGHGGLLSEVSLYYAARGSSWLTVRCHADWDSQKIWH